MPFLWNLGCQPAKKVGRTQDSVAKWSSANKIRVHYGIWWHLQESRDSSLMGNTQFPRDRRGWGGLSCPAENPKPEVASVSAGRWNQVLFNSRVLALSDCVCSRLIFERDRVMALMFVSFITWSEGELSDSYMPRWATALECKRKGKAFIEYHCMHWRGKASEKMLGVGWGGF